MPGDLALTGGLDGPAREVDRVGPAHVVAEETSEFLRASQAANTVRAYASDWAKFEGWCTANGVSPLPVEPVALANYLAQAAAAIADTGKPAYSPATLGRWVAAINAKHRESGHLPPGQHEGVARVLAGVRRTRKAAPKKAKALRLDALRTVLDAIPIGGFPRGVKGRRDAFLLLLGFAGAFRQSELAGLTVGDVTVDEHDGLHVTLRASKTDQSGVGMVKAVPFGTEPRTCTPCAFARWRWILRAAYGTPDTVLPTGGDVESGGDGAAAAARTVAVLRAAPSGVHVCRTVFPLVPGEDEWPLFQPVTKTGRLLGRPITGPVVHRVIVDRMRGAGLDPAGYSGHSLRAGFVTEADAHGATVEEVMRQTGHRNPATVEGYVRRANPLQRNAVTKLGL